MVVMAHCTCPQGGGRFDASIVRIPEELVEAGLIRQYEKLPFQARCLGLIAVSLRGNGATCTRAPLSSSVGLIAMPALIPCLKGAAAPSFLVKLPQGDSAFLSPHPSPSLRQEYYEVLHSCLAVVPAFASDAYYINKVGTGSFLAE